MGVPLWIAQGGVMLRSQNQMKPLYDYSYYLSIISFDFLILNSYKHVHQFQEGLFSIMMAMLGGVFTCVVGILVFPQYAGGAAPDSLISHRACCHVSNALHPNLRI